MEHNLEYSLALLARFPKALDALLRGLPEAWTLSNEGPQTWNCYDVVGHLLHLERHHRMERIHKVLRAGESEPFDPVDRFAQTKESAGKSLEQLLDEFAQARQENIDATRALGLREHDFALRGRHTTLGSATLSEVLASWVVHDLTHLHQISRILAHQYRDATGIWSRYLGVLRCTGHSE